MTDKEFSIKEYARINGLDTDYATVTNLQCSHSEYLKAHNFFFLNPEGYCIENKKSKKNNQEYFYIKEVDFFRKLKSINRRLKLEKIYGSNL